MKYSNLHDGIYKARSMAEHPERHTRQDLEATADEIDSDLITLWEFVGAIGKVMHHTSDNEEAWYKDSLKEIGLGLAAISELALGIEATMDELWKAKEVSHV